MNVSIEKKKEEAIARMRMLGIFPETIRQFDEDGKLSLSEPPLGAFYWLSGDDLKCVRRFEKKHNALVYVVIRTYYVELGAMDSYLYVSDYEEEWTRDRDDLKNGTAIAYVNNLGDEECSEFGSIGIKRSVGAGLLRTW